MHLYTTTLKIKDRIIPDIVSREEGNKFLLYKPQPPLTNLSDIPIFWVAKQDGQWTPINVKDEQLIHQVHQDILLHQLD